MTLTLHLVTIRHYLIGTLNGLTMTSVAPRVSDPTNGNLRNLAEA